MATTDLLHKNLTDPQLHEPIGISTAEENTVYIADGEGSGKWKNITFDRISFEKKPVSAVALDEVPQTLSLTVSFSGLSGTEIDQTNDNVNNINWFRAVKEFENIRNELEVAHKNIAALNKTVEELRAALIDVGVIANG
jgi:hypothetical protein